MSIYIVEGYQGSKQSKSSYKVKIEADEMIISKCVSSNAKKDYLIPIVKFFHFPKAEIVEINYFNKTK